MMNMTRNNAGDHGNAATLLLAGSSETRASLAKVMTMAATSAKVAALPSRLILSRRPTDFKLDAPVVANDLLFASISMSGSFTSISRQLTTVMPCFLETASILSDRSESVATTTRIMDASARVRVYPLLGA